MGVLIVALIIFLLPTLALYYFLAFIALVITVLFIQVTLIALQMLILHFPSYLFVNVLLNPLSLPNSIVVERLD